MKKGIIVFAAIIAVGTFAGCGKKKNQVVCTGKAEDGGEKYEVKIIGELKDNKIVDGSMEMKFSDDKTASTMCGFMAMANSMAEDKSKQIDYTCKGKKLIINSLKTWDSEQSFVGITKEEFIKQAKESSGDIKCK